MIFFIRKVESNLTIIKNQSEIQDIIHDEVLKEELILNPLLKL